MFLFCRIQTVIETDASVVGINYLLKNFSKHDVIFPHDPDVIQVSDQKDALPYMWSMYSVM